MLLTLNQKKKLNSNAFSWPLYRPHNSWVEVSAQALLHNIAQYKKIIPRHALLAPVIKGNAYGHGLLEIAQILETADFVDYVCVVSLSEALFLRTNSITKPILILSILDTPLEDAIKYNIDNVLYDTTTALELNTLAQKQNKAARVHIKIDTGLSRLGIHYTQAQKFIKHCLSLPHIQVVGFFSHYIDAEDQEPKYCALQKERFDALVKLFPQIPYKHFSCSAALSSFDSSYTFARFGIGLYGLWPSQENRVKTLSRSPQFSLQPVLTWKTKIIAIKKIPAESTIGYNATFTTQKETITAVLPIGYWDGYDRKLSNCGRVKIHNQYAPVLGRIAMNMIVVDISDIPQAQIGDTVILLGADPEITAETLAKQCGTINYEITTRINPLLKRIVV